MKLRTLKSLCLVLCAVFCFLMLVMGITQTPAWGYAAIGVAFIVCFLMIILWRCPHCGKYLGRLGAIGGKARYCPFCGEKIEL